MRYDIRRLVKSPVTGPVSARLDGVLLLLVAVCLIFPVHSWAQDPGATPYHLSASARLVTLDVVVLDKSGKPVSGLDRSQFTVYEDKQPQTIKHFESSRLITPGGPPQTMVHGTADLKKIGNSPVNIFVFDELNSKFEDMAYARAQIEKYIQRQPEILPVPTQLVAAGDNHFVVIKDYTQSRADLLAALAKHMPQYPWQMMRNAGGDGALERMAETLGILGQIADASRGTPGRKNVIWAGAGYPFVDTTEFGPDDQAKMLTVIKTATERMLASRVTLYIIDASGVYGQNQEDPSADVNSPAGSADSGLGLMTGKLQFTNFSQATGGEVFSERNDIDGAVEEGLREAANYYTLSYTPTSDDTKDGAYRNIRIVMQDKSLHAVTRAGYYPGPIPVEAPPTSQQKTSAQLKWDLAAAAQTTLPYDGLDVEAVAIPQGYRLDVVARGLSWSDQPDRTRHAQVTVMAVFFGSKDKQMGHVAQELTESIHPSDSIEHGERAAFSMAMKVPTNTTRIRFVVRDAGTGTMGSADVTR
jgi:VWFA-related protein